MDRDQRSEIGGQRAEKRREGMKKGGVSRKDAKAQRMTENEIGKIVVDAAIAVHRGLGPGLLETVYEIVLAHELSKRGLHVDRQVPVSIDNDGIRFDEGFRADKSSRATPVK